MLSLLSYLSQPSVLGESNDFRAVDNFDLSTGLSTGLMFLGFFACFCVASIVAGFRWVDCDVFGIAGVGSQFCVALFTRFALLGVDTLACVCVYCSSAFVVGYGSERNVWLVWFIPPLMTFMFASLISMQF